MSKLNKVISNIKSFLQHQVLDGHPALSAAFDEYYVSNKELADEVSAIIEDMLCLNSTTL